MATIRADVAIDRTPDQVWDVVGDIGGLWRWMPGVDEALVVGDERVCTIGGGGGRLVERVLSHDDTTRRYEYSIVEAPMPLDHHRAAMWVEPDGDGSRFFWEITVEPDAAAEPMRGVALAGAEALKEYLEN